MRFTPVAAADAEALAAIRIDANRFYLRHGFVPAGESEFDLYDARPACRS